MPVSNHIPMPAGFLSLAPATSSSYPLSQEVKPAAAAASSSTPEPAAAQVPLTPGALAQVPAETPALAVDAAKPRTESTSSVGSKSDSASLRYLTLGPVHQGAHLDGAKGDWHDLAVE